MDDVKKLIKGIVRTAKRRNQTYQTASASSLIPSKGGCRAQYMTTHEDASINFTTIRLRTQRNGDDPTTSRSEGGHSGSISQAQQANDNHTTRRAAAETRMTTTTHADDSREGGHCGWISHLDTTNTNREGEERTITSRTLRPKRTTRLPTTTTAPRRAPEATPGHSSNVTGKEERSADQLHTATTTNNDNTRPSFHPPGTR